jgi:hypothetical protein
VTLTSTDDSKHPHFFPQHGIGTTRGVPFLEDHWILLSEISVSRLDSCSRCRIVRDAAGAAVTSLGSELFVHISLSRGRHIFAFRIVKRSSLKRMGLSAPPQAALRQKKPFRFVKIDSRVPPWLIVALDDEMKKRGLNRRSAVVRALLFEYFREKSGMND